MNSKNPGGYRSLPFAGASDLAGAFFAGSCASAAGEARRSAAVASAVNTLKNICMIVLCGFRIGSGVFFRRQRPDRKRVNRVRKEIGDPGHDRLMAFKPWYAVERL